MYFDGGSKASCYCSLRDHWKNFRDGFVVSNHLKRTLALPILANQGYVSAFAISGSVSSRVTAVAVGRDQQGLLCWPENTRKNESDFFDAATPYETTKIDQSIKIGLLYFIIFLMTTQRCA